MVQVLSGQENKVHENIVKRIKTEEMGDYIFEVVLPTERVSEVKRGKKTETTRKFFPGYLIVNMWLLDENKQLVDKTGISSGHARRDRICRHQGSQPIPMRQSEVDAMLAQVRGSEERSSRRSTSPLAKWSRWATVHSKTRTASSKRSIPSAANCASPSASSAATRRSTSNTGRSNAHE